MADILVHSPRNDLKKRMSDKALVRMLKIIMSIGIILILIGVYFHNFSETIEQMGVTGIIISACFVAIGMILSLPTKMYLTFILVKREADSAKGAHNPPEGHDEKAA